MNTNTDARRFRLDEHRTPAAHNITSSTIDEFLDPSADGDFSNDTATLKATTGAISVYEYNTDGDRTAELIKQGRTGTAYYVSATDYLGGSDAQRMHLVTAEHAYPTATTSRTDASRLTTSYSHAFWTDTDDIETKTTTLPSIPSTQNGSGSSATLVDYLDSAGRLRWQKDALGYVAYYPYHPENGELAYTVRDADPTSLPTSADGNSTKWVTSSDGSASSNKPTRGTGLPTPLEQVSFNEFDSQGREVLMATEDGTDGTVLARHYSVYETSRTLNFPHWNTSTNRPLLPIRASVVDDGGKLLETYTVDPASTTSSGGVPTGISATQSDYLSWTRYTYSPVIGNRAATHVYHDIPSSGYGSKDTNYAETLVGYDPVRRQDRLVAPGGTITRTVFDNLCRPVSTWIGTDDTPSSGDWSPTNNSGANMTKVTETEYDGGSAGGNGNRTKQIAYLTDAVEANARVSHHIYDWRDRAVFMVDAQEFDGKVTYGRVELDNLGRAVNRERYYDADDDADFPSDGTVDSGDRLLARTELLYDNLGQTYRTKTFAVDPSNGTVGSALVADAWRDAAGQVIKRQQPGSEAFSKTVFDGLGRPIKRYAGYDLDETAYSDADDVTGDTILQQNETVFDAAGNPIQTVSYARKHTASGTGALTTSTARANYSAAWYDAAHRRTASANYGTNGGSAFTRPSSVPARSDTILVTTVEYNTAGRPYKTTDPAAREDRQEFDDAGRPTKSIQNYTDGNPATGTSDQDVTVQQTYNSNGTLSTLTAKNSTTGDQTTKYIYGTATGGITPEIYRNDLLRAEIYPDSDDTTTLANGSDGVYDRIELKYNIAGNVIEKKDQLGTIHTYDHDLDSRLTQDRVTTLGTNVDNGVLRLSTTYNIRGQVEKQTSHDNATVGSGNVVNEIVSEYNDMGMLLKEYQEHEGAKDANTLYVQYNRDTTASGGEYTKGLRLSSVRYPNTRLVHTTYGTSGSTPHVINRLDALKADSSGSPGSSFSEYTYLGLGTIVKEDFIEPDVRLDYDSGTAGTYDGFDRFGRVVNQLWQDYGASTTRDQFTYGYDRSSNRLYRENTSTTSLDEFYTYDGINRLATADRGDLNSGKTAISGTPAWEEDWGLDMTGNWSDYVQKTSGTTDLDQARTQNEVNEITAITASTGTNWADPIHDRNGNMTTIPKPSSPAGALTTKYDAWNRLAEVKDGATAIGRYEYDGRDRRVKRHIDTDSPASPDGLDTYIHYFHNNSWQTLETRQTTTASAQPETLQPKHQYAYSPRYIDSPSSATKTPTPTPSATTSASTTSTTPIST